MLIPQDVIHQIATAAYWADRMIRADLIDGYIANENDYTSNLTREFRRQINVRALPGLTATAFVLEGGLERAVGADATIIISDGIEMKICYFEAKWPRWDTTVDSWDHVQASTGESHFDSQLQRQAVMPAQTVIWEMFYIESPYRQQKPGLPDFGSACVGLWDALPGSKARAGSPAPWTDAEFDAELLRHVTDISTILRAVCECTKGTAIPAPSGNLPSAIRDFVHTRDVLLVEYDASLDA